MYNVYKMIPQISFYAIFSLVSKQEILYLGVQSTYYIMFQSNTRKTTLTVF